MKVNINGVIILGMKKIGEYLNSPTHPKKCEKEVKKRDDNNK